MSRLVDQEVWEELLAKVPIPTLEEAIMFARRLQEDQIRIYQGSWFSRSEEEIDFGKDLNHHMEVTRESNQGLDQGKANQYAISAG